MQKSNPEITVNFAATAHYFRTLSEVGTNGTQFQPLSTDDFGFT